MPVYSYHCNTCNETFEELRPIDERYDPIKCLKCNQYAEREIETSRIVSHVGSILSKTPASWRNEVLEPMKKAHPGSKIRT